MINVECDTCGVNLQDGELVTQVAGYYTVVEEESENWEISFTTEEADDNNTEYHHKECY